MQIKMSLLEQMTIAFSCWIVMRFAIWYHLYNLNNMKNIHGVVLLLVKLQDFIACNFTKSNTPLWEFSTFWNCTNGIKLRRTSHMNV